MHFNYSISYLKLKRYYYVTFCIFVYLFNFKDSFQGSFLFKYCNNQTTLFAILIHLKLVKMLILLKRKGHVPKNFFKPLRWTLLSAWNKLFLIFYWLLIFLKKLFIAHIIYFYSEFLMIFFMNALFSQFYFLIFITQYKTI